MCAFGVLCEKFFITPTAFKFLHHYNVNVNKKEGWVSLASIPEQVLIDP